MVCGDGTGSSSLCLVERGIRGETCGDDRGWLCLLCENNKSVSECSDVGGSVEVLHVPVG